MHFRVKVFLLGLIVLSFCQRSVSGQGINSDQEIRDEVIEFLKKTKPKQAFIQHFSLDMLEAGIEKQAEIIEKETGVKTIAAKDGMVLEL